MPALNKDEALAFVEAIRLALNGKRGFNWFIARLSDLEAFIESTAEENQVLNEYVDSTGVRDDYEAYAARRASAAGGGDE